MGKTCPFSGKKKKSNAFPLRPGMPRAILTLPLCFLILLFSVTAPYLNILTDMLCQTHTHRWLMWCLLTISANSFPLHALSLASYCDEELGNSYSPDWTFLFWRWPQHRNLVLTFHHCGTMEPKTGSATGIHLLVNQFIILLLSLHTCFRFIQKL